MSVPSRRRFLVGGALLGTASAALSAGALLDTPAATAAGQGRGHGGGSSTTHGGGVNGPTFRAGDTVDHAANGFHPSEVLRAGWDDLGQVVTSLADRVLPGVDAHAYRARWGARRCTPLALLSTASMRAPRVRP